MKKPDATNNDRTQLLRERDDLRAQLAQSEQRIKSLEDANKEVARRLDSTIESVKDMMAKG
jgi:hypothetical protein